MQLSRARSIIAKSRGCVLATWRPDGSLQLNPVVPVLGDDGSVLVATRAGAYKIKNILANPRVSLCVYPPTPDDTDWAQIDGSATVDRSASATAQIVFYYERANSKKLMPATVRDLCDRGELALIRVRLESAVPE
ncbi:pyridoxamine 5'-phosphate oxidase family protein [Micromonospora avicenniae]|uniref:pyridoxamine 5'-phosphate oxidase family protein n=1 Tax=Micromonospora avicenniae TaxID=1198245 RepID=UPI00343FA8AC